METLRISIIVVRLVEVLVLAVLGLGVHAMYRRRIHRYERLLTSAFSDRFEKRTVVAKSVHHHLADMICRSKSVVDQVRQRSSDGPEASAALNQVSEWLAGAAGESDRALRSLENGHLTTLSTGYIARGEHVAIKANSHHDR